LRLLCREIAVWERDDRSLCVATLLSMARAMTLPTSAAEAAPAAPEDKQLSLFVLSLLALTLGVVTGLGAVLFRELISLLHNLFFAGQFSFRYDANIFTAPSRWGPFVILAPVIGGVIVTFLVSNFAPEAKGHGVPEVMDAIYHKEGVIRPIVALVKSVASAVAIGSGSSVGREGPIIQIGSAFA
jgi:CIC family chloride channel protein